MSSQIPFSLPLALPSSEPAAAAGLLTPPSRREQQPPGIDGGWRRLAQAQHSGDSLALATASAALARRCLAEHDLEEAQFHLQRARRILTRSPAGHARLLLQCDLVGLLLALCQHHQQTPAEPDGARLLAEEARDAGYDVVRDSRTASDPTIRATALLRVADCLAALGDQSDALALRMQALNGVGGGLGATV